MFKGKIIYIAGLILILIAGMSLITQESQEKMRFHSEQELKYFKTHGLQKNNNFFPIDSNVIFPTAKVCSGCHGHDNNAYGMVDEAGNDINVYDDWRSTMMANSAKDPFWRAKVSHEILINPGLSNEIQTKCTSCHAPMGHYTQILRGAAHYTINDLIQDTIGLDGVSCLACHSQKPELIGQLNSGFINYDTTRVAYGPYDSIFVGPMGIFVGLTPKFGPHVNNAGLCASCHTLLTSSVDLNGTPTGQTFVEQATYHEWLNSSFNNQTAIGTCQGCHMQRIEDGVVISANYAFLLPRSPFGLHQLAGANVTMLKLMKANKDTLGLNALNENFDSTIALTNQMLQQKAIQMKLEVESTEPDTAFIKVELSNKAGHKFPSGYPSRRAILQLVVIKESGDTLFQSGLLDNEYQVIGEDLSVEPHYDVITDPGQAQIYEMVMGDVNGNFTTVLERAFTTLKDNRLVPQGFTTSHYAYDTTQIVGSALTDPDFNKTNGVEGNGKDVVHYHIPLNGYNGYLKVFASVLYQTLPPKWMAPLFQENTPEIHAFQDMYNQADLNPVLVAASGLDSVFVESTSATTSPGVASLSVSPNPTLDGKLRIQITGDMQVQLIKLYTLDGKLVRQYLKPRSMIDLPEQRGVYLLVAETNKGRITKKVLRQ